MGPLALFGIIGAAAYVGANKLFASYGGSLTESGEVSAPNFSDSNVAAFLAVIRAGESSDNYRALVGGGNFSDYSTHPSALGWDGWRDGAGILHTNAGAYQIGMPTYRDLLAIGAPDDFSPEAQDALAVRLIQRRGAYDAVASGDIISAVPLLRNEWEIFTQPKWSVDKVISLYQRNGGFVA